MSSNAPESIAQLLDHTLLKADAQAQDIDRVCQEAIQYAFASVCVNSAWIERVAQALEGHPTLPIAVVGFPLGAMTPSAKVFETREAIRLGAREIDMVLAVGHLKSGQVQEVLEDIRAVVKAAHPVPVKVILETAYLNREEKILACRLSQEAGAAFVKTSTGFGPSGATVEDVRLMRETVGPGMGVKASGGIRSWKDAQAMIEAGANRLGVSASVAIVREALEASASKSGNHSTLESHSSQNPIKEPKDSETTRGTNPTDSNSY